MLFSSSIFLFAFLPIVIMIYYGLLTKENRKARNVLLFFASILFYAWGEPKFVFVMLFSIILNWHSGLLIDKNRNNKKLAKLFLILALIINVGLIFIFKYLMFTASVINNISGLNFNVPIINLPIGISFFTFQSISYIIDVYRGNPVQKSLLNLGLYISLFPQLIAGPIVRYQTIANQIDSDRESFDKFTHGVCYFIYGLSKKVLISNQIAVIADKVFDAGSSQPLLLAWLGIIAYTLQIYYDFSGYSDMAIGLGRMFGFEFEKNFDYPYISKSISEFWRRWHISLGTWFRDYIYFPLGGSRVSSKFRLVFNLFIVWLLTGIWHGAAWTFIIWGLYYFAFIAFEKLVLKDRVKIPPFIGHIYTLFFVMLGWVLFRGANISAVLQYYKDMFGLGSGGFINDTFYMFIRDRWIYLAAGVLFAVPIGNIFRRIPEKVKKVFFKISTAVYPIVLIFLFVLCSAYLIKGTYNPFIYFNF